MASDGCQKNIMSDVWGALVFFECHLFSSNILCPFRPMFEEDVPSVMELEMEELDQWMKKDGRVL